MESRKKASSKVAGQKDSANVSVLRQIPSNRHGRKALSSSVKHGVSIRDGGQCTYVHSSGKRCEERRWLHVHHVRCVSEGGRDDIDNLVTLCSSHHRVVHMNQTVARASPKDFAGQPSLWS